jgi:hypothetical protein
MREQPVASTFVAYAYYCTVLAALLGVFFRRTSSSGVITWKDCRICRAGVFGKPNKAQRGSWSFAKRLEEKGAHEPNPATGTAPA